MNWKRKAGGGVLATIGFILSPLTWWNDLFVNIPLALVFAWVVALFYKPAFNASVVIGYWLTNVLGLVLLHKGVGQLASDEKIRYTWRAFGKDVGISALYTALIVALIRLRILSPVTDLFQNHSTASP